MNTHFLPAFSKNINFPNLLTKISPTHPNNSIVIEEKHLRDIYKNYQNPKNPYKVYQKLNKIKIYFVTKYIDLEGKKIIIALPINTLDDLSNSGYSKALTSRVGIFQMVVKSNAKDQKPNEGKPGNQPFLLEHTIKCNVSSDEILDISLENLKIPQELELDNFSEQERRLLRESKLKLQTQFIVDQNGLGRTINYYVYNEQYEYDYVFLDNTIFTNVELYSRDPRDRDNFKKNFIDKLENLKSLNLGTFWDKKRKTFSVLGSVDIFYKNTDELVNKNIIPIFSSLEDAQNLLITIIEEILEPYKKYDFSKQNKLTPIINVDYIDASFNFKNKETFSEKKKKKLKIWLINHKIIKSYTSPGQYYQDYPSKKNMDNQDDSFHNNINNKFFSEKYINDFDEVLFSIVANTKIVSMGLGDFLYFFNNKDIKNGEALFIPSLDELNPPLSSLPPIVQKKSRDRFYEYQKEFQNRKLDDIPNYLYELK